MGNNDVELRVGLEGNREAQKQLDDLGRSVESVEQKATGAPKTIIDSNAQADTNAELGDTLNKVSTIGTLLGVDRRNLLLTSKAFSLLSDGVDGVARAFSGLATLASKAILIMLNPAFLGLAAIVLGIKVAYDKLAESQEKAARAQAYANAEAERSKRLIDDLKPAEEKRAELLAKTEGAIAQATGAAPDAARTEATARAVAEASARTGIPQETLLQIAASSGATTADAILNQVGGETIPEGQFRRQVGEKAAADLAGDLDVDTKRQRAGEALRARIAASIAADEAELKSLTSVPGRLDAITNSFGFSGDGGGVDDYLFNRSNLRKKIAESRNQLQIIDNSINFNAPDARRTRPSTSQIGVP